MFLGSIIILTIRIEFEVFQQRSGDGLLIVAAVYLKTEEHHTGP
jgi:hypothetical protein